MPYPIQAHEQISILAPLHNRSMANVADSIGVKRQNMYNFLKTGAGMSEERQALMLQQLGITKGNLSHDSLHRWYASPDLTNIKDALPLLLPKASLDELIIINFALYADDSAILVAPLKSKTIYVLLHRPPSLVENAAVTPESIGCGTQRKSLLPMSKDKYAGWLSGETSERKILHELREFVFGPASRQEEAMLSAMPQYEDDDSDSFEKEAMDLCWSAKDRGLSEEEIVRRIKLALSI